MAPDDADPNDVVNRIEETVLPVPVEVDGLPGVVPALVLASLTLVPTVPLVVSRILKVNVIHTMVQK